MFILRELNRNDIFSINKWRNDPELIKYLGAPYRYIDFIIDEKWYEDYLSNRNTCVRCSIVDDNSNLIGLVSLLNIDSINRSATFGIMIGEESNCGSGAGSFAVSEMVKHGFMNMNLNRIELGVLSNNNRAIHVYEKCGFKYEGTKRSAVYKNGEYIDLKLYAILREDYLKDGV